MIIYLCICLICLGLAALIVLSAFIFAKKIGKMMFWKKPLGKDEWTFAAEKLEPRFPGISAWVKERLADGSMKEMTIEQDGQKLHAYYLPYTGDSGQNRTVVLTHGFSGCALQMMPYAKIWREELHCNVLVHDLQNHGQSSGDTICMGKEEYKALLRWIGEAEKLFPGTDIYLQGISMGGATTVMALGAPELPASVKGGIADSAFTNIETAILDSIEEKTKGHLPKWFINMTLWFVNISAKHSFGWGITDDPSPLSSAAEIRVPVLYVCGNADHRVNCHSSQFLYDNTRPKYRHLFKTHGEGHCRSILHDHDGYLEQIKNLI